MKRFCNFIAVSIFLVCLLNSTLFVSAQQNTTYFKYTTTDNNSTIIFQKSANVLINGQPIEVGDEIGVFTTDSLCVGAGVWSDTGAVFAVWGNDALTGNKDGINPGEQMHFRIWSRNQRTEYLQDDVWFSNLSPTNGEDTYSSTKPFYLIDSLFVDIVLSVPQQIEGIPKTFSLSQNYPNPFNPETRIRYSVPHDEHVKIEIFSVTGRRIKTLVDSYHQTGIYEVSVSAQDFSSGTYFYRMQAGDFQETKKFLLLQ